jgi:signal transduction histidine kinase
LCCSAPTEEALRLAQLDLNQVFLNLPINAAHAIRDVVKDIGSKGKIRVATRADGDWVEISVTDSGAGIPEAVRSKIFDPFRTTKEVGKGTGQGLALARAVVVDKHGGTLTYETEMGKGTAFRIRLPLATAQVAEMVPIR